MVGEGRILLVTLSLMGSLGVGTAIGQLPLDEPLESAPLNASQQKTGDNQTGNERVIQMSEFPPAPKELAKLIQDADVRFITGGEPKSTLQTSLGFGRLAGETRFKFRYRFDSRARWELNRASRNSYDPEVFIRVRFRSIKLIQNHDVWLRRVPSADRFWDDRVVLHEFDHVRISSDRRVKELFLRWVKELETIRVPFSAVKGNNGKVDSTRVQQLIDQRVSQILTRTTDMVRIRYRELDRLTKHGLLSIPEDADFSYDAESRSTLRQ